MAGRASLDACQRRLVRAYKLVFEAGNCAGEGAVAPRYLRTKYDEDDYADCIQRVEEHIATARSELDEAFKWLRGAEQVLDRYPRK